MGGVVSHTELTSTLLSVHGLEDDRHRLLSLHKEARLGEPAVEATTHRMRLIEMFPAEARQRGFISRDHGVGLAWALEDHFNAHQGAGATANHATKKAKIRQIDKFGRQVVRVAHRDQVDRHRTFGIWPREEAGGELANLSLALSLRERAAHRITSSPPM
jgi:hypothetical protein